MFQIMSFVHSFVISCGVLWLLFMEPWLAPGPWLLMETSRQVLWALSTNAQPSCTWHWMFVELLQLMARRYNLQYFIDWILAYLPVIFQLTLNGRMILNDKLRKIWKHQWPVLRCCLNICLQRLRRIMEICSQ